MPDFRLISAVAAASVSLAACTAFEVPPEQDPTYQQLQSMEVRLSRVERVVNNDSLVDILARLQELQSATQELRNEIETLQFEANQTGQRQRELYLDLDQRLAGVEKAGGAVQAAFAASGATAATAATVGESTGNERDSYQAAFDLLKAGRYAESEQAFRQFMQTYPDSDLMDNARYWLAETFYVTQRFEEALKGFQTLINEHPDSQKLPDALLKIGYCNYELERWDEARAALSMVISRYPESTAARLAQQRLDLMRGEGR